MSSRSEYWKKRWRERDREKWNAARRKWYRKNKKKSYAASRKWVIENPDRVKAQQLSYRNRLRLKAMHRLGGPKCVKCGFDDWRALQIDHINGGGRQEERKLGSNMAIHRRVLKIKHPEVEYQVLCANCNTIKRYTNNECAKKCRSSS